MLDDNGRKVFNAAFGLHYTLKAEISKSDGKLLIYDVITPCITYDISYTTDISNILHRTVTIYSSTTE